jgi:hypothetical protein
MLAHRLSGLVVAALLATTVPLHAQTAPAGAGAATAAAAGPISAGVVLATLAGVTLILAASSSDATTGTTGTR